MKNSLVLLKENKDQRFSKYNTDLLFKIVYVKDIDNSNINLKRGNKLIVSLDMIKNSKYDWTVGPYLG